MMRSLGNPLQNAVIASLACLWISGCGKFEGTDKAFHIMVISLGSMDDAELDGLDSAKHPNLVGWLGTSTRYSNFQSSGTDGMQSLASMLTGLRPEEHGAGANEGGWSVLAESHSPMAEYLFDHTYNPGAVVSGDAYLSPELGLNAGFREYEWVDAGPTALAALASDWIVHHTKQPFFFLAHLSKSDPALPRSLEDLDAALGEILRTLAASGHLDSAYIMVTATEPRTPGATLPLLIKTPKQAVAQTDARKIEQVHLCQLILQHAALPVAAVRPNAYLTYPLPAPVLAPGAKTKSDE